MATEPKPPQLRMSLNSSDPLQEISVPDSFELRQANSEDASSLTELLNEAYPNAWTTERTLSALLENSSVPVVFILISGEEVVATASYLQMYDRFPRNGWVHYVGASPRFSGLGLGKIVTQAVVKAALVHGDEKVSLNTDDWRLPAIATYLSLGFRPEPWHESHESRWADVFQQLACRKQPTNNEK
jgi:mycothiol synthase